MGIYDELSKLSEHPPIPQTSKVQQGHGGPEASKKPRRPSNRDTTTPRNHAIMTSSMTSRHHDTMIEIVRKSVKVFGKEPSTHRLTPEEKKAIIDIVYAYKSTGIKTSENEIARIAIDFLVNDYKENGENSILHKVLKALNE